MIRRRGWCLRTASSPARATWCRRIAGPDSDGLGEPTSLATSDQPMPMHTDEIVFSEPLVRGLLRAQFPHWADLPPRRIASGGTSNALYRLGDDLTLRLPLIEGAARDAQKEWRFLPRLAPHLPLPIPAPLALGQPTADYPYHW